MSNYSLRFTDSRKLPIEVQEDTRNSSDLDIVLFGRKELEYGKDLNENLLHILENFACPEDAANPGNPDINATSFINDTTKNLLTTPTEGQLWYNKTKGIMYGYDGTEWFPLSLFGEIAANWGQICNGEQIPKPISQSGYVFEYDECSWIVSPSGTTSPFDFMECRTDDEAVVTMTFGNTEDSTSRIANANYLIVGIKNNVNLGTNGIPVPSPTPTPTATPAASPSPSVTPTPSVTISVSPTQGIAPSPDPTPTPAATLTPTPTPTPFAPLTVSLSGTANVFKFWNESECPPNSAPSASRTAFLDATPSGGSGSYAYNWTYSISGDPVSVSATNLSQFSATAVRTPCEQSNTTVSVTCTVTDTVTGSTAFASGVLSIDFER